MNRAVFNTNKSVIAAMVAAAVLSACGGGGGGSSSNTGSGSSGTGGSGSTISTPTTPVNTTVASPTYAKDSAFKTEFFNDLNAVRKTWGISLLSQNASLDTSAGSHASYLGANLTTAQETEICPTTNLLYVHSELADGTGYTGFTPGNRDSAAGYTGLNTSEVAIAAASTDTAVASSQALADTMFTNLMNTIYHRTILMNDQYRDIGLGYASPMEFVADVGVVGTPSVMAASVHYTYPTSGQANVIPVFNPASEVPNPIPSATGYVGSPISFALGNGNPLTITSFTLVDGNGANVPVQQINATTDTALALADASIAHIVPTAKLNLGTTYTATFVGSTNGSAINYSWSFTTPANAISGVTQSSYTMTAGTPLTIVAVAPTTLAVNIQSVTGGSATGLVVDSTNGLVISATSVTAPTTVTLQLSDATYTSVPVKTITVVINP